MYDQNPYLSGPFAPVDREVSGECKPAFGEVPRDFGGVYVRNGPNPRFEPKGRYHWFDGDGMLHAAHIEDGRVHYRNRYVQTEGLGRELAEGRALWGGVMESVRENPAGMLYKDTSNTDIVFHGGLLKTSWWLSSRATYEIDARTLETRGKSDLGAGMRGTMSAHPKVDPVTGEMMFFGFGMKPPFMQYGVVGPSGKVEHRADIPLPGPRLPHDMAITENYSVLMDLPIHFNLEAAMQGKWRTEFVRESPARFGVIPRRGTTEQLRWFEAEACYVYHVINSWEEGDEIVMVGCRVTNPLPTPNPEHGKYSALMANLKVTAHLHEWRFDLKTGQTRETQLDDRETEFPAMNLARMGRKSRYGYSVALSPEPVLLFSGVIKYDTEAKRSTVLEFGEHKFGSEVAFAPRIGANPADEDDGYLTSFVTDRRDGASELWIIPARDLERGPVARVALPARVPLGFHATWVDQKDLAQTVRA